MKDDEFYRRFNNGVRPEPRKPMISTGMACAGLTSYLIAIPLAIAIAVFMLGSCGAT